jgi:hypothetical protein
MQPQRLAEFAMLAQPHLGFAKGPVLVTHQAENRQQLGLVEQALAEATSHRLGDLQGDAGKRQESPSSAIAPPTSIENNNLGRSDTSNFHCHS